MDVRHNIPLVLEYAASRLQLRGAPVLALPGTRCTILLVHGFAGEHTDMADLGHALHAKTGYAVRSVDLSEDRPALFMDVREAAEILAYRFGRQVTGRVVFVAHSFGGLVCLEVTRVWGQYPHLFSHIDCGAVCTLGTPRPGTVATSPLLYMYGLATGLASRQLPPLRYMLDPELVRHTWDYGLQATYALVVVEGGRDVVSLPTDPSGDMDHYTRLPLATHLSMLLSTRDMPGASAAILRVIT
jgi:pimeloyl-ACP methyl ester carboxylesterase